MSRIIEALAALVKSVYERAFLAGQEQPPVPESLPAIGKRAPSTGPRIYRDLASRSFSDEYGLIGSLCEELQRGVGRQLLEYLI